MKPLFRNSVWIMGLCSVLMIFWAGCYINIDSEGCRTHFAFGGCSNWVRQERQVTLSELMEPGMKIDARTINGSITLKGQESHECTVHATIVGRASTAQKAQEVAETTEVLLERQADCIKVIVHRPRTLRNRSVGVNLDIFVPRSTMAVLQSSDGRIDVEVLDGQLDAKTSDGNIGARQITGSVTLQTSDGSIKCQGIQGSKIISKTSDGNIRLDDCHTDKLMARTSDGSIYLEQIRAESVLARTSDGGIVLRFKQDNPEVVDVELQTSDGSIDLVTPPSVSARIEARTSDGSIHSEIMFKGSMNRTKMKGVTGAGQGNIYLKTSDGSIHIK